MTDWERKCLDALLAILDDTSKAPSDKADSWTVVREELLAESRKLFSDLRYQRINLTGVSLQGQDLSGFNLSRIYFARVHFDRAILVNTSFRQSIFDGCSMAYADIEGADFWEANLTNQSVI